MDKMEEYSLKKRAYISVTERRRFSNILDYYENEFSKPYKKYLPWYLIADGAFVIQLDNESEDAKLFEQISFLLKRKKQFQLSHHFVTYLKNIYTYNFYYLNTKKSQEALDSHIKSTLSDKGLSEFINKCFTYLDTMKWETDTIIDYGSKRNSANVADYTIVECVSYLIRRAADLDDDKSSISKSNDKEQLFDCLINKALSYLYSRQKIYELCLFNGTQSGGIFINNVKLGMLSKDFFSGVIMNNIWLMQPLESGNHFSRAKNESLCNARMLGIPYEDYFTFDIVHGVSFFEILMFRKKFSKMENLHGSIGFNKFQNLLQNGTLCEALSSEPNKLIDLYQTPFLLLDGRFLFSSQLILHNRVEVNVVSSINKKMIKTNCIEKKGQLFQKEIFKMLKRKISSIFESIDFSISVDGKNENGDIDIIALESNRIHIIECKSVFTPLDYYDYRRDLQTIFKSSLQLDKISLFLSSPQGKKKLNDLFNFDVSSFPIHLCIVISNCRTACTNISRYPVYSSFEVEMAVNNGSFFFQECICASKNKHMTNEVFKYLRRKTFANAISKSINTYDLDSRFLFSNRTHEYYFDHKKFLKIMSKKTLLKKH